MLVGAVSGIDDTGPEVLRQQVGSSRHRVADHHEVDAERLDVAGRVDEALTLGNAGTARGEVDDIGAESAGREAEAHPGPRGSLEEEVHHDPAGQAGLARRGVSRGFEVGLGAVEDGDDLTAGEILQPKQVLAGPGRHGKRTPRRNWAYNTLGIPGGSSTRPPRMPCRVPPSVNPVDHSTIMICECTMF